ncbi:hypothetical protein L905_26855 [Agrobacterium sp. TS43]|nr:hypothetical protein L901_12060 [Agrobacterium sp. D14]KVK51992.1 hypothetical protein L903_01265 [Agrobacterium sp. JL28]KVK53413.1 hypothetical protein L904_03635 [Agrobacterium sp. LY4]KVK64336.1 hypothetical protein L906_01250 [Agrobacterium sp. TS45]KVK68565.1 hypothetical protein L907_01255 [Agrobacterium sp. C13]KVK70906.1 hypothetical protein L905_26855 [Agrobacterium sp. TS43]
MNTIPNPFINWAENVMVAGNFRHIRKAILHACKVFTQIHES